ncbi:HAD family hydrolase [Vibrio maerlii]|uniref:HAD family hydrolase n=1 Tax=Vibrio maerlii TaxID=2231648 RepID=UPI000E3C434B|nr:HAD family phosphatase [Vibrio maerlii]
MKFKAAIFDMDGLLLDTERVCMDIFQQTCEALNLPFYPDKYLQIIGRNAAGIEHIIKQGWGDDLDYPTLNAEWRTRYNAVVKHQAIPKKSGVIALLDWLKHQGYAIAVATSTQNDVAKVKLQLAEIDHYFDVYATGCEVKNGKPDPEIFLLAAERLGVCPTECIAFEDSNNGARAAVAANMTTFQIPDLVSPCEEVRSMVHFVKPSLDDVLSYLKLNVTSA